ncbi:MAG: GspH/FimT family pseudopilin [Desulfocapsa sp.]|nr:GspH/FimT family pseudopilin [Desulfocapsa sp.]
MSGLHLLKNRWNTAGLTAIELMTVIAIVMILTATSSVFLAKFLPDMRLKSAARDLYSTLQQARALALKNNRPTAVFFDNANNQYSLFDNSGDGNWATPGDNNLVSTTTLTDYRSGVTFGHLGLLGNLSATGGSFPADNASHPGNRAVFNERGTCSGGYVYLDNAKSLYAVGSRPSGFITLLRWRGGTTWE